MKRGILVATLMMTAAGVASANLLTTAPQGVASPWPQPQPATEGARPVTTAGPEKSAAAPAPAAPLTRKGAPAPTVQKASVETRQAPVPFQPKPRPPVSVPPVADKDKDKATEAKATGQSGDKPAETSSDPAGEKAARAAIEADGYKGVTVLRKGANGVWHASALRGKTTVMLTVDGSGSVSAD
ncbi:MAG TPA: hypothetical protein VK362_15505 [Reyranella sp.]|nr:hypothetical protein [Reyranella sp.]